MKAELNLKTQRNNQMDAEEKASKKTDEMPKMQTQDEIQEIRLCGQLCMVGLFLLLEMTYDINDIFRQIK